MKKHVVLLFIFIWIMGCTSGPREINFGEDQCAFCRMTIFSPKYGALLVTDKGRIRKYDATECLINDLQENRLPYQMIMTVAYDQPKKLIWVDSANFVISTIYNSPMGANLAAFDDPFQVPDSLHAMTWKEVLEELSIP